MTNIRYQNKAVCDLVQMVWVTFLYYFVFGDGYVVVVIWCVNWLGLLYLKVCVLTRERERERERERQRESTSMDSFILHIWVTQLKTFPLVSAVMGITIKKFGMDFVASKRNLLPKNY